MKVAARIGEKLRREIERGRRRSAHSSVLYTLYLRNTLSMHPPFRRKPACLSPACLCVAFCRERTNAIVYQPLPIAPIVVVCRGEREIFSNTLKRGYRRVRQYQTTLTLTHHLGPGALFVCFVYVERERAHNTTHTRSHTHTHTHTHSRGLLEQSRGASPRGSLERDIPGWEGLYRPGRMQPGKSGAGTGRSSWKLSVRQLHKIHVTG